MSHLVLLDHVYLRHPWVNISANISANYINRHYWPVDILAEKRPTYWLIVDRYLADSDSQHCSAECRSTYRPSYRPRISWYINWYLADSAQCWPHISPHIDCVSASMSTDARLICRLIHWSTSQLIRDRHVEWHSTIHRPGVGQYVDRLSTKYWPICQPTGALNTHDPYYFYQRCFINSPFCIYSSHFEFCCFK